MIAAMNKYAFLIFHREYDEFLLRLRELGVVHIQQRSIPDDEDSNLRGLLDERKELVGTKKRLALWLAEGQKIDTLAKAEVATKEEGREVFNQVEDSLKAHTDLLVAIEQKKQELKDQELWGDFEMSLIQNLEEAGYTLAFYSCPLANFTEEYAQENEAIAISSVLTTQYFVRLEGEGVSPCANAERLPAPTKSLSELKAELKSLEKEQVQQEDSLAKLAETDLPKLMAFDTLLLNEYSFGATRLQALPEADDKLMFLEGWVPRQEAQAFEDTITKEGYYCQALELTKEDKVPILLKNNFFVKAFEPITEMFSLPNYGEFDQTVFLAPFFMLFFGLCLGDGGYGILAFLLGTFLRYKAKPEDDVIMYKLLQWLGASAFVVGMFTGSLFGVTLPYADPNLHPDYFLNQNNLMRLSIILGFIQIFFGKGIAAYKTKVQLGLKYALSQIAWIVFLVTAGAFLLLPEVNEVISYIFYGLLGISVAVILFYNNPDKNPVINVGGALWETYNTASGLLGDVLSYIRLFAIGLTGSILGGVFNLLAIEQTEGLPFYVRFPMMLVILLVGHGLNFGIAMIGSFVHPVRLTLVEFYKNSAFEGGGKRYTPFEKK